MLEPVQNNYINFVVTLECLLPTLLFDRLHSQSRKCWIKLLCKTKQAEVMGDFGSIDVWSSAMNVVVGRKVFLRSPVRGGEEQDNVAGIVASPHCSGIERPTGTSNLDWDGSELLRVKLWARHRTYKAWVKCIQDTARPPRIHCTSEIARHPIGSAERTTQCRTHRLIFTLFTIFPTSSSPQYKCQFYYNI